MPVRPEKPYIARVFYQLSTRPLPVFAGGIPAADRQPPAAFALAALSDTDRPAGSTTAATLIRLLETNAETVTASTGGRMDDTARHLIQMLLKTYLPSQDNLLMLFSSLRQIRRLPVLQRLLPAQVQAALDELEARTATPTALRQPRQLRQAVLDSGYFLENRLLHAAPGSNQLPASDLKFLLLRLLQTLTGALDKPAPATPSSGLRTTPRTTRAETPAQQTDPVKHTARQQTTEHYVRAPRQRDTQLAALLARTARVAAGTASSGSVATGNFHGGLQPAPGPGQSTTVSGADTSQPAAGKQPAAALKTLHPETAPPLRDTFPVVRHRAHSTDLIYSKDDLLRLLFRQSFAALARMHVAQLSSLPTETDNRPVWIFDLPLITPESTHLFSLRISRDERQDHTAAHDSKTWSVMVSFDLPETGPTQVCIRLTDKHVDMTFRTADQNSKRLFEDNLGLLTDRLTAAGLEVGKLHCVSDASPDKTDYAPPRHASFYVDEEV